MDQLKTPSYRRDLIKQAEKEASLAEQDINLWKRETPKFFPSLSELERFKQELSSIENQYHGVQKNELKSQIDEISIQAQDAKREYQKTVEHHIESYNFLVEQLSEKDQLIEQLQNENLLMKNQLKEIERENQTLLEDKQCILNTYVLLNEEKQKVQSVLKEEKERSKLQVQSTQNSNSQVQQENIRLEQKVKQLTSQLEEQKAQIQKSCQNYQQELQNAQHENKVLNQQIQDLQKDQKQQLALKQKLENELKQTNKTLNKQQQKAGILSNVFQQTLRSLRQECLSLKIETLQRQKEMMELLQQEIISYNDYLDSSKITHQKKYKKLSQKHEKLKKQYSAAKETIKKQYKPCYLHKLF